jgi:hypothetical protein
MWRRALRIIVITAFALQATYVVVANVLLMTPWLRAAVPHLAKGTTHVTWDRAWTLWWGDVHARGFSMQFDDQRTLQFDLRAERGETRVSLPALFKHHILLHHPRASGVSYRMGLKVPEETVKKMPRRIDAFPPVPPFEPPSVKTFKPNPPVDPAHYDQVWSYELRDLDVDLDELWVDEVHYVGRLHATGGFNFEPFRRLWVGVSARLEPGSLEAGPHVVSRDLDVKLDLHIAPVGLDPRHPESIARATSMTLQCDADLAGLDVLELYSDRVRMPEASGQVSAQVELVDGRLQPKSVVETKLEGVEGSAWNFDFRGGLDAKATVEGDRLLAKLTASADLRLPPLDTGRVRARSGPIKATARLGSADLATRRRFEALDVSIEHATVADARPLTALVARHAPLLTRRLLGTGPLTGAARVVGGPQKIWVTLGDLSLGNVGAAAGAVRTNGQWNGALQVQVPGLAVGLRLSNGRVTGLPVSPERWFSEQMRQLGFAPRKAQAPGS